MTRYLLNSALLTSYGDYNHQGPVSVSKAREWLDQGPVKSAIGHASTAALLSFLLKRPVERNRVEVAMLPGDEALVLRAGLRLGEGEVLDEQALRNAPYEMSLLRRMR
ncbi:MAG: DUF1874 domain-containing protein [bacterium]|nr:DUF1874 domain-containing protein [bacterium]